MNRKLANQFQAFVLPELLEDCLEEGHAESIAFNRWGTILAAGLQDGNVVLWDFETRGVSRILQLHSAAVTALAWKRDGRVLLAAAADGSVKLWNLVSNTIEGEMSLGQHVTNVSISRSDPHLCLVSFPSIAPALLDFREERSQTLPCLQPELEKGARPISSGVHEGITAVFSKSGRLIYMSLANGSVAVLNAANLRFIDLIKVPGGGRVHNLAHSKDGQHLVLNYQDRVLRALEVLEDHPRDLQCLSLPELRAKLAALEQVPNEGSLLHPESSLLKLMPHTFQDLVDKHTWQCAGFTCDSEYLAAASAAKDAHLIHIWTRAGRLERILEGPKLGTKALVWHPRRSLLATLASSGAIFLWACVYAENWSAFAPGFTELQENEEFVEPEDVFDVNPKPGNAAAANGHADKADAVIDILTEELQVGSSDEEESQQFKRIPVEIIPQDFDDQGQLVREQPAAAAAEPSPEPSSRHESEPAISDAGDAPPTSQAPEEMPRETSPADLGNGVRLRPLKQKRYHDEFAEDEMLLEDEEEQRQRRSREAY